MKHRYFSVKLSLKIVFLIAVYVIFLVIIFFAVNKYYLIKFNISPEQLSAFHGYSTLLTAIYSIITVVFLMLELKFAFFPIRRLEAMLISYQKSNTQKHYHLFTKNNTETLDKILEDILNEQKKTLEREHKAELLRKDTELSALISQINPHFLYNTLDSIRGYAVMHDIDEIADLTESLSILFRNVITKTDECISLEEELKNINYYITIQQFRFNNRFHLIQKIEDYDLLNYTVLNLTLQPIVENAIFHGLENKVGKGEIIISVCSTEKRLILTVADNGVGIEAEKVNPLNDAFFNPQTPIAHAKSKDTGIALVNINKRIKLHFGDNYGLKILSTVGVGTNVEVILPLIFNESESKQLLFEDKKDA